MARRALPVMLIAALCLSPRALGQSTADTTAAHCATAKAAAGADLQSLYARFAPICEGPSAAGGAGRAGPAVAPGAAAPARGTGGGRGQTPARDTWYRGPAKVFDNLYFLGTKIHTSWALQTSAGLIVIDTLYEYATKDEILDGLRTLGLDPASIKYLVISHGHGDHSGGAKMVQDAVSPRLVLGGPDWDLLERGQNPPRRDIVATDGQGITLGDTTVTVYTTPGHTAGTLSVVFPVKDNGRTHMVATWGGTALTAATPVADLKAYIESAVKYRRVLTAAGVEGMLSNHSEFDSAVTKLDALAARKPGGPHPFLTGQASVGRYMTVVEEVARAALALPRQ